MLPFFRKIRWRLAQNNQFFKYSRYAVGEIMLVVIGILIALQINNWNEKRKGRIQELETYKVISRNIEMERKRFNYVLRMTSSINNKIDSILNKKFDSLDTYESLFNSLTNNMPHHKSNSGYMSMVNNNTLNNISNNSLRDELTYFYDNVYNRFHELGLYDKYFSMEIMEKHLLKTLSNSPRKIDKERLLELLRDPYFVSLLRQCREVGNGRIQAINNLALPSMKKIDSLITEETNKSD